MKFPIIFWQQNIVFDNRRRAFAVYKLPLINYDLLSINDKISAMNNLRELIYNLRGEYHILSLCRSFDVANYHVQLEEWRSPNYLPKEYEEHVESTYNGLMNRNPWVRELYLVKAIPLKNVLMQIRSMHHLKTNFRSIVNQITDMFVTTDPSIPEQYLDAAFRQEDAMAEEIKSISGGQRASSKDIEWIIKHNLFRALGEPDISVNWDPAAVIEVSGDIKRLIPLRSEIIAHLDDCYMYEAIDHIKIEHVAGPYKGKTSYQAFLAMSNYPDSIKFPGIEYFQWLDNNFNFPIDVSIKVTSYDSKHAQLKLSGKMKELQDQKEQHANAPTGIPLDIHDNEYRGLELESKIKSGMPLIEVSTVFCVAADSKELMEKRAGEVVNLYKPRQFKLVRTPGDQKKFFSSFIIGSDIKLKEHTVPMDPEYFASGMMTASRQIGDPFGFYFGDNLNGPAAPVFLYPMRGPRILNRSAATAILGTLGGGKSVTRKYILYCAMTIFGAKVISIDPKNEDFCFSLIPEIRDKMKQVDLGPGCDITINPFHIATTEETSRSIVTDLLFMLLNAESDEKEIRQMAIHRAIGHVMNLPYMERNMFRVIDALEKVASSTDLDAGIRDEANRCKLLLESFRELDFSRLIFSEHSNIDASAQLTVFNFAGLPLPADKNSKMSNSEKFGSAILFLVTSFARQILLSKEYQGILKILSIDEAWKMMMTPEGIRLITEIIRMGRSMGIMPIIATQNANDLSGTEIRNNLGMVLMFRNNDREEIKSCLEMLGLDTEDEYIMQRIPNFASGQCLFRDVEGRVGEMWVRPRPRRLLQIFNTKA